ncbi:hypothetical protein [Methylotenera sp.]|jgi:hypothetical protein|uniref:hypothetical protein n=3 Tax=Methylotenera sp. TaxID=2051956 RepID=UPI00272F64E4|nr:hypothetical protein [Methylotenera sp.]MDP2071501.1 hypothetical protein [Methylotenera sp.]MDP3005462.1 hypothetical protein [Methylotenera sp.]
MDNSSIFALALSYALVFVIADNSKTMYDGEYQLREKNIEVEFKAAKVRCNSLSSDENDSCIAAAESIKNTSIAKLEANAQMSKMSPETDIKLNNSSPNLQSMPVIEEPSPAFKKPRLI